MTIECVPEIVDQRDLGIRCGCVVGRMGGSGVKNPMSPEQARAQVMGIGNELLQDLGLRGNLVEATFSYKSCSDESKGPFRGMLALYFWMPGEEGRLR